MEKVPGPVELFLNMGRAASPIRAPACSEVLRLAALTKQESCQAASIQGSGIVRTFRLGTIKRQ